MSTRSSKGKESSGSLGLFLRKARDDKGMSLREVEGATDKEVSNAYLSQLESGKIAKPSPHILYALSKALGVEYENLMQRAGYLGPAKKNVAKRKKEKPVTYAIENLTADEESELMRYLKYYRSTRK